MGHPTVRARRSVPHAADTFCTAHMAPATWHQPHGTGHTAPAPTMVLTAAGLSIDERARK